MKDDAVRPLGDEKRHYWLALGMAQASGCRSAARAGRGRITHGDWAEVVTRCRGCGWTEGCDCWLAAQDGLGHATVPQACPNVAFFEAVLERHGSVRTTRPLHPDTSLLPLPACRPRSHVITGRS
jgi:hypothetical protein